MFGTFDPEGRSYIVQLELREAFQTEMRGNFGLGLGFFWTWDFFETELPPKNSLKQVEYEKYWYKINQYEWYILPFLVSQMIKSYVLWVLIR